MRKIKLGEVLDVKRGASISGEYYATEGDLIRLTLGNFNYPGGGFKPNTSKDDIYYAGPVRDEFIMKKGDIITPLTEQVRGLLGETAIIPESGKYVQNGDIGKIIPNEKVLDKSFAAYLISSPVVKAQLDAAAQQTKIRHTSPDKIKDCTAWIPELLEQKKIGKLMDDINAKIKANNQINSQLESLAKTIYDYWFLQFEFPNEEGKPYKSSGGKMVWCEELKREIPEGWEVSTLKNMYEIKRGISYSSKDIESGEGIPMINLACIDINRNYRDGELKYYNRKNAPILDEGDMLIATTDLTRNADIVGCPIITPYDGNKYTYSMDLARIDINCPTLSKWYVYSTLRTESYHNYIKKWASGTNVLHLNLDGMNWYTTLIPDIAVQKTYAGIIEPIVKKQSLLMKENRELSSLRDFLLPMLMNGQVTFKDN